MLKWLASKWRKFDIVKEVDGQQVLYLRRFFLWRCRWFNIFLHYIPQPDTDRDPHDHPWSFVSILLRGGYEEEIYSLRTSHVASFRRAPSIARRKAGCVHQIRAVLANTWTLVITGPYRRHWGFLTHDGWKYWRDYLNIHTEVDMD